MTRRKNRLSPRKAPRAAPPSPEDLKRYARLVEAARKAVADPGGDIKGVAKARNAVRGRTMPPGQAVAGSPFDRLCRMTERWPGMLGTARLAEAETLAELVEACSDVLRALDDAPLLSRQRADLNG